MRYRFHALATQSGRHTNRKWERYLFWFCLECVCVCNLLWKRRRRRKPNKIRNFSLRRHWWRRRRQWHQQHADQTTKHRLCQQKIQTKRNQHHANTLLYSERAHTRKKKIKTTIKTEKKNRKLITIPFEMIRLCWAVCLVFVINFLYTVIIRPRYALC